MNISRVLYYLSLSIDSVNYYFTKYCRIFYSMLYSVIKMMYCWCFCLQEVGGVNCAGMLDG